MTNRVVPKETVTKIDILQQPSSQAWLSMVIAM